MHAVLFDAKNTWQELLPLTFTRPVAELRFGILTISEKWALALGEKCSCLTMPHLAAKWPCKGSNDSLHINGAVCPDKELTEAIRKLKEGESLWHGELLVACFGDPEDQSEKKKIIYSGKLLAIQNRTDLFTRNGDALANDFRLLTSGRKSEKLSATVTVIGDPALVFAEKGAKAEACILNTTGGPIYLGEDSEVMEGSAIRGPFSLGAHSAVKLNTKIYGPTTVGPHCKVGGEINNSVIFGYSNKAHDGFLGNSVIGEWCNLGADTNNSNLKNNYGNVKLFDYRTGAMKDTGLQFCGLIMGDHSKCGINTMFNTGTVVGVGCNVFGGGFPPVHVPSFSWGGSEGLEPYRLEKMFETASRVFERRGLSFTAREQAILRSVQELSLAQENSSSR